jgi:glutamine amidotransferase
LIAILDYGSGNLRSAERAFATSSKDVVVTRDPDICEKADGLVIPGVGAFAACMNQLLEVNGAEIIKRHLGQGKKIFGICVGMQILFSKGLEKAESDGLDLLPGEVSRLNARILPHIGWNSVKVGANSKLFSGIESESFYFVHSYALNEEVAGAINTLSDYEGNFVSAVETELISAVQFHPEKSGTAGLSLIKNWVSGL